MNPVQISQTRYTAKHYDPTKKIPAETIEDIKEILRNAPSSINAQPWHFYLAEGEAKEKIIPAIIDFNVERARDCSHLLVCTIETKIDDEWVEKLFQKEVRDGRYRPGADLTPFYKFRHDELAMLQGGYDKGEIWTREQVAIATGFLLFALPQLGIDSTTMGAVDFKKLDELLDLKAVNRKAVCVVALGYRSEGDKNATRPKSRFAKEDVFTTL